LLTPHWTLPIFVSLAARLARKPGLDAGDRRATGAAAAPSGAAGGAVGTATAGGTAIGAAAGGGSSRGVIVSWRDSPDGLAWSDCANPPAGASGAPQTEMAIKVERRATMKSRSRAEISVPSMLAE
jgi:hypothetical protein